MNRTAAVFTLSDKASRGERIDTSGPAVCQLLADAGWEIVHTAILPDEQAQIEAALRQSADKRGVALVVTTGGTGFSPRDVTPEATKAVIERETPGIPEQMRAESMKLTPHGCLSRACAGIRGRTLIVNLPGSEKAARENLTAVLPALSHGVKMLQSEGSAECASQPAAQKVPSLDGWLREAQAAQDAGACGMYLFHVGVVRQTAKIQAREGASAPPVTGMRFSYDRDRAEAEAAKVRALPGIHLVRVFLNEGSLQVGDTIMQVLVGGDTRPHVLPALEQLVQALKTNCVTEQELF